MGESEQNNVMNEQILQLQQLAKRVEELERWKEEKTRQQISYPLDSVSVEILNKDFLRIIGKYVQVGGVSGREFTNFFVKQAENTGSIPESNAVPFTANATSNVITVTGHAFANDDRVYVFTDDTLPAPLDTITTYYVVSSSGMTFKLSLTSGGSAIDITDAGTGVHYIDYL